MAVLIADRDIFHILAKATEFLPATEYEAAQATEWNKTGRSARLQLQ